MNFTRRVFIAALGCGSVKGAVGNCVIFSKPGRFGGWPANHGMWQWGREIVVGFTVAWYAPVASGHAVDRSKPREEWQARSIDGGVTWILERPEALRSVQEGGPVETECPGGVDFESADFAMMFRFRDNNKGPSRFYCSMDRCRTWRGPYRLPDFGQKGVSARTDYLVEGRHRMLAFMSAAKSNGFEGRPFCARTSDGAKTWRIASWIGPEPEGYAIMPSTVRLGPTRLITVIRRKARGKGWLEAWESSDNAASWEFVCRPAPAGTGNPPSLIRLKDGRLCLTYGFRQAPFGIRAKLSEDAGKTWGKEIVLRDDGGTGDLGYPRSLQLTTGEVLTVYYFNGPANRERTIEATIWAP